MIENYYWKDITVFPCMSVSHKFHTSNPNRQLHRTYNPQIILLKTYFSFFIYTPSCYVLLLLVIHLLIPPLPDFWHF